MRQFAAAFVLVSTAALALAGCGGASSPQVPGSLMLGTAALDGSGFLPLEGDQTLVPGSQGGFHIWLKYRVSGMGEGRVQVQRTVRRVSDDHLLLTASGTVDLGPEVGGYWETPKALPSFMCPSPLGVNVIGEAAVFDVQILDANGRELGHATAEATALCPTDTQAAFCQQICSG
jgi:hypothetical protein